MKRHDEPVVIAVLNLLDEELLESGGVHPGGVNDLARLELEPLLEDHDGAVLASEGDLDAGGTGHDVALLGQEEILVANRGHTGLGSVLLPGPHGGRPLGNLLVWGSSTAI